MRWIKVVAVYLLTLFLFLIPVSTFEPISSAIIGLGLSYGGYRFKDKIMLNTYCKVNECCHRDLIPFDILSLRDKLETKLFGQHIVQDKVFKAVASHYEEIERSKKPLVMTFHGTQGVGKNYVANMIAEAVFEKKTESKFFHIFHGSHYENIDKVHEHREAIRREIFEGVEKCPYSIFVFDEVDKMPPGIFDSIKAMLDHSTLIKGKDFTKAIFIFLTNFGGDEISHLLHRLEKKEGLFRHETKLNHFEPIMRLGVFNKEGGLQNSNLIKSAVIDFYIPFLPLEEKHVIQCIKEEFIQCGREYITKEMTDEILNYIGFNSITFFAHTGCKTIYAKVQADCF